MDSAPSSARADAGLQIRALTTPSVRPAPAHAESAPRRSSVCEAGTVGLLDSVYRAVESRDLDALRRYFRHDAFMFSPEAAGVFVSLQEVAEHAAEGFAWLGQNGVTLRIRTQKSVAGKDPSGEVAWTDRKSVV